MSVKVDHASHSHTSTPPDRALCEGIREQAARAAAAALFELEPGSSPTVALITPTSYLAQGETFDHRMTCVVTVEGADWYRMSILVQWLTTDGQLREHRTEASLTHGGVKPEWM